MQNNENKKHLCCHKALALIIVVLLTIMAVTLVFKVGLMVGLSKTGHSSWGASYYKGHAGKGFVVEQYEAKAKAMGMTLEELKKYMVEEKKSKYEESKAEVEG